MTIWKVRKVGTTEEQKQAKDSYSITRLLTKEDPIRNGLLPITLKEREGRHSRYEHSRSGIRGERQVHC